VIILEILRVANRDQASIRLYLSRGPGNFSANPYDSVGSQLYIAITKLTPPATEKYANGIAIGISKIPVKNSWMAQVKSCNYLPNVLMKKESVDRKIDFVIGLDKDNNITESATENILIVDRSGTIVHPPLDSILKGTTMVRACELAREAGLKAEVRSISMLDLQSAKEMLITGTSLNVLPVVTFENEKIGDGKPGIVAKKLNELLVNDIKSGVKGTPY
jgi:4-amino-4-deoxychorismate lyase